MSQSRGVKCNIAKLEVLRRRMRSLLEGHAHKRRAVSAHVAALAQRSLSSGIEPIWGCHNSGHCSRGIVSLHAAGANLMGSDLYNHLIKYFQAHLQGVTQVSRRSPSGLFQVKF